MKKRLLFIFLLILIFSLCKIDVNASKYGTSDGAALHFIYEKMESDDYDIYEKDKFCFYKTESTGAIWDQGVRYVVIYFKYDKNNNYYVINDITGLFSSNYNSYHGLNDSNYLRIASKLVKENEGTISGEHWYNPNTTTSWYSLDFKNSPESLCRAAKVYYSPGISQIYLAESKKDVWSDWYVAEYTNMTSTEMDNKVSEKQLKDMLQNKKIKSQYDKKTCDVITSKGNNIPVELKYNDSEGYYLSGGNTKVCFAVPDSYNILMREFFLKEEYPDFYKTFDCTNYITSMSLDDNYPDCDLYFVDKKNKDLVSDDITTTVTDSNSLITTYISLASGSSSNKNKIYVYKTKNNEIVVTKTNDIGRSDSIDEKVIINDTQKAGLLSGDKTKYPIYVIRTTAADKTQTFEFKDSYDPNGSKAIYIVAHKVYDLSDLPTSDIIFSCEALFGTSFIGFLKRNVYIPFVIAIPILLIVLTTIDFAKVVFSEDKEGIKKAGTKFGKRAIMAVIILLVPTILIFIADTIGVDEVQECAKLIKSYSGENSNTNSEENS